MVKYLSWTGAGCLIMLLIVGIGSFFVWRIFNEPVNVVNEQLQALREGKIEKAYGYFSSAFQQQQTVDDFREWLEKHSFLMKAQKFTSLDRRFEGSFTQLNGSIHGADGFRQPARYDLIKEKGVWKIEGIEMKETGLIKPAVATASPLPAAPAAEFVIRNLQIKNETVGGIRKIEIQFEVAGFHFSENRMHLVQDLEIYSPKDKLVPELSRKAIKEIVENRPYTIVYFTNTLTLPGSSYPKGKYRVRIVVHDPIGNASTEASGSFEL